MAVEYKGYKIEGDGTFGMKVIRRIGAGTLPQFLLGSYTKVENAKADIDSYLAQKQEEADKPAPVQKVKLTPREI